MSNSSAARQAIDARRNITNRWTGARTASFSTRLIIRRLDVIAAPGQLRRSAASTSMDSVRAKRLLPNMPDELFRLYMEPMISQHGWPFYSLDSPTTMPWWQLFDCHDIRTISELLWERREFPFSIRAFHRYARTQIAGLVATHVFGDPNEYSTIPNTQTRFFRACTFVAETGRLPLPVVLMKDTNTETIDDLRILDGNHRLAAMASLPNSTASIVDCWLGTPPR